MSGNFRSNGRGHGVTRESGERGGFDEEGATHPSSQRGWADCHPPVVLYTPTVSVCHLVVTETSGLTFVPCSTGSC